MVIEINEADRSVVRWSADGRTNWRSADIDDLIRAYEANRWIPVTERPPEEDGEYLCTVEDEDETDVDTLLFAQGAFGHIDWEVGEFVDWGHEVTAWMLLPTPYKKKDSELSSLELQGYWIIVKDVGDCCYRCSKCGFIRDAYILDIGNYCPNCGAKME